MVENWDNVIKMVKYSKAGILSKELTKNSKQNLTLFCMAANTKMSEHTSTKGGFVFVLEGKGIFNLEGEDIPMAKGTLIYLRKNAKHSLKVEKNTAFLLSLC